MKYINISLLNLLIQVTGLSNLIMRRFIMYSKLLLFHNYSLRYPFYIFYFNLFIIKINFLLIIKKNKIITINKKSQSK